MRFWLIALICTVATTVFAEERQLSGKEISDLLPTILATGVDEDTRQTFSVSGIPYSSSGSRPSTGKWWVTATQYCSSWPPSDGQACYDVLLDEATTPNTLIWIGDSGRRILNTLAPKEADQ